MTSPAPRHAVIVPHYNDTARLARCLDALLAQAEGIERVEIIVADNNSTTSLDGIRAAHPGLRIVTETQPGAAHARNRGVAETTAPGLIFIDADCVPLEGWLARAVALDAEGALIGGRVDTFDETPPPRSGAEAFERVFAFRQKLYVECHGFSASANLVTTRAVFETTGPFRAGVSEDKDWSQRAVAAGFQLRYDNALAVTHPSRQDWAALVRKWRRINAEGFGLVAGSARGRLGWGLRGLAMPLSILAHAPRILRHSTLTGVEKRRALATLARLRLMRCGWMLGQALRGAPAP